MQANCIGLTHGVMSDAFKGLNTTEHPGMVVM